MDPPCSVFFCDSCGDQSKPAVSSLTACSLAALAPLFWSSASHERGGLLLVVDVPHDLRSFWVSFESSGHRVRLAALSLSQGQGQQRANPGNMRVPAGCPTGCRRIAVLNVLIPRRHVCASEHSTTPLEAMPIGSRNFFLRTFPDPAKGRFTRQTECAEGSIRPKRLIGETRWWGGAHKPLRLVLKLAELARIPADAEKRGLESPTDFRQQ
jgi:hypothetical protein